MPSTQSPPDTAPAVPSWVQKEEACRQAWQHDRRWRKAAKRALHAVHILQLTDAARKAYQASGAGRQAQGDHHHAAECPCNPCRKRRGEKVLPTLRQQQETRKRAIGSEPGTVGYEPGDREEWLLSADDRVRWTRVVEAERDPKDKITRCELRPEWLGYLDSLLRKGALEDLWQNQPHLARAFCGCAMDGRTQEGVAQDEGVSRRTIGRRVEQARTFLAERVGA